MDFAMPDENAMELMRREFAKLHICPTNGDVCENPIDSAAAVLCHSAAPYQKNYGGSFPIGLFLVLYFMKMVE